MKYEEPNWKTWRRKGASQGTLMHAQSERRYIPPFTTTPPSSSSPTPPPFSVLREHADSWLSLWWRVRGPESPQEGSWDQLKKSKKAGRQVIWEKTGSTCLGTRAERRQERRILSIQRTSFVRGQHRTSSQGATRDRHTERKGTPGPAGHWVTSSHRKPFLTFYGHVLTAWLQNNWL